MADWEGFTEADLRKMQSGDDLNKDQRPKILKPVTSKRSAVTANKTRQAPVGKRVVARKAKTSTSDVSPSALLSQPPQSSVSRSKSVDEVTQPKTAKQSPPSSTNAALPPSDLGKDNDDTFIVDDESVQKKDKLKLEDVHQRQKQMEEKNRRKKAMLTKEIAERKKKALAESSKLLKIQSELTKLDQLLNMDVSVLRDKIDDACMEFSHAQKRFERAEAEYIASKMELHHKTTIKEDLTEHLFNLIQANEERKAKKLEELMNKLDVEEEELEEHERKRKQEEEAKKASQAPTTRPGGDQASVASESSKDETKPASSPEKDETKLPSSPSSSNSSHVKSGETNLSNAPSPASKKPSSQVNGDSLHGAASSKPAAS